MEKPINVVTGQKITDEKRFLAHRMRREMTPTEALLWERLRDRRCAGAKFRRQQIVLGFIADFYCVDSRLAIEVDGTVHNAKNDAERDAVFARASIRTLRFTDEKVANDIEAVLKTIEQNLTSSPLSDHTIQLIVEPIEAYLAADEWIDFAHPEIERVAKNFATPEEAYLFVRDTIRHSYDIRASEVTATASEVLAAGHGICYAKAHLLAAILRAMGIPAGLSYQRLVLFDDPKDGYSLHAVNTLYLAEEKRWIRVDARGNKPGVNAQFRTDTEMLAFPIRSELGEIDYRGNFAAPPPPIRDFYTLQGNITDLYTRCLPDGLTIPDHAG